jgi:hypothetical protein
VALDLIFKRRHRNGSARLREAVSFHNWRAEADLQEVLYLLVHWCRGSNHLADSAAKHLSDLAEDQLVVAWGIQVVLVLHVVLLRGIAIVQEPALAAGRLVELSFDGAVDLVPEARHRGKDSRAEGLSVFN